MVLMLIASLIANHVLVSLIVSIIFIIFVYFSNYIRLCYYVYKIPGPRAYPIIGNGLSLKGSHEVVTKVMCRIATEYAPMTRIWFGPIPVLVTIEPKIIQELLNNQNALEKAWLMKLMTRHMGENAMLISEVPLWKRSRNIIVKGFTVPILKSYFKIFVDKVNKLTEILDKQLNAENTFDIYEVLSKTALDSVCASSMGVDMNAHEEGSCYFEALQRSLGFMMNRLFHPLTYPDPMYKLTQDYKNFMQCKNVVSSFTSKIITEKRKDYNDDNQNNLNDFKAANKNAYKKPLLDYMMDFTKNNYDFTDVQLEDDINLVIIASFDTTSKTISMVLLLLALYKDDQKKVCEELFQVLGNRDKIDFDDLPKLKYMEMVIKETMRLFPVIPLIARELTEDINIENYRLPKGANIMIPIFCVHRNKHYWVDPLKFDPDRFSSENIQNQHPYAFIPFSAGPRNCIGARYAWIFMKQALATLLSRYEFHTNLKSMNEIRFEFQISLTIIDGYQLKITPRSKRNN